MVGGTDEPAVVRVSQEDRATIPKRLREKFEMEAPGEVFVYEEGGRIIIDPVPSRDDLHGIHAGEHEHGELFSLVARFEGVDDAPADTSLRDADRDSRTLEQQGVKLKAADWPLAVEVKANGSISFADV